LPAKKFPLARANRKGSAAGTGVNHVAWPRQDRSANCFRYGSLIWPTVDTTLLLD